MAEPEKLRRKARKNGAARVYWPNCSVCQYMKKNQDFRYRIMQSTYFNPQGKETAMEVVHEFGDPFKSSIMYAHFKRHQHRDLIKAATKFDENGNLLIDNRMKATVDVIEHIDPNSTTNYELGLDEFIKAGRDAMARGEMKVTASTFIQAMKVKGDIANRTKDRRADLLKGLFKGAAPSQNEDV